MQENTPTTVAQTVPIDSGALHTVGLNDTLDIASIEPLYRLLETALSAKQSILLLDAELVTRVDASALQLLAVFYREARTLGYQVRWKNPSIAMCRAAAWIGLTDWLELKNVAY